MRQLHIGEREGNPAANTGPCPPGSGPRISEPLRYLIKINTINFPNQRMANLRKKEIKRESMSNCTQSKKRGRKEGRREGGKAYCTK